MKYSIKCRHKVNLLQAGATPNYEWLNKELLNQHQGKAASVDQQGPPARNGKNKAQAADRNHNKAEAV